MRRRVSIAELQSAGLTFRPAEAVAIVRQLIHSEPCVRPREPQAPSGPPSAENVFIDPDGAAACIGCETTPAVSELAILLQRLLPTGTPGVSGGLRYTVARALLDVDAPPFDSIDQFAAALERHEPGDPRTIVRRLLDRVAQAETGTSIWVERRRTAPCVTDLRRQLRAADARVYEQQLALDALAAMTAAPRPQTSRRLAITIAAAAVLIGIGAGEARLLRRAAEPIIVATAPSAAAPAPADIALGVGAGQVSGGDINLEESAPAVSTVESRTPARSDRPTGSRVRRQNERKLLDRLHLKWLRGKVAIRADAP